MFCNSPGVGLGAVMVKVRCCYPCKSPPGHTGLRDHAVVHNTCAVFATSLHTCCRLPSGYISLLSFLQSFQTQAKEVSDKMFASAAQRLADYVPPESFAAGTIYPELSDLRDISLKVGVAAMKEQCCSAQQNLGDGRHAVYPRSCLFHSEVSYQIWWLHLKSASSTSAQQLQLALSGCTQAALREP